VKFPQKKDKNLQSELEQDFFETSAKTRFNVEPAFEELVRETRKWLKKYEGQETKKIHTKTKKCQTPTFPTTTI